MRTEVTQDNKLIIRIDEQDNEVARKSIFAQQFSKVRQIFENKILRISLAIILTVGLVYTLLTSDYFTIKKVEVINAAGLQNFSYVNIKNVTKETNKLVGQNFFMVNVKDSITNIVNGDTFVSKGFFEKAFPNKITIRLYERTPEYLYKVNDAYCALVDQSTFVMLSEKDLDKCTSYITKYPVPQIFIYDSKVEYKAGSVGNTFITENLLKLFESLSYFKLSVVSVSIRSNICEVLTTDGKKYIFSFESDYAEQLIRFRIAMNEIFEKKLEYSTLDVRYQRPVTKN